MESRSQDLKSRGNKAFAEGRIEEAVRLYTQALSVNPTSVLYLNRAAAYLKLAKYEEALKDARAVSCVDHANLTAYLRKGLALMGLGRLDEARSCFMTGLLFAGASESPQSQPQAQALRDKHAEVSALINKSAPSSIQDQDERTKVVALAASFTAAFAKELGELVEGKPPATEEPEALNSLAGILRATTFLEREVECIDHLVAGLWATVAEHPALTSITAETLHSSCMLAALLRLIKTECGQRPYSFCRPIRGGRFFAPAVASAFCRLQLLDAEREAKIISLLSWFVERCTEELRLSDPWGAEEGYGGRHLMMTAVLVGPPALVSHVASKGNTVSGPAPAADTPDEQPLWAAYKRGRVDNFIRLLELGARCEFELVQRFIRRIKACACFGPQDFDFCKPTASKCDDHGTDGLKNARLVMIREALTRHPEFLSREYTVKDGSPRTLLETSLDAGDACVFELLVELGMKPRMAGCSTLFFAIWSGNYDVVELLVNKYKLADGNSQYDDRALRILAQAIAVVAVRSYPEAPGFDDPTDAAPKVPDPRDSKVFDLMLGSGLKPSWDVSGMNPVFTNLMASDHRPLLSETHTLELLERFRKAGWNVASILEGNVKPDCPQGNGLAAIGARYNQPAVFDYAFETAGCVVDGFFEFDKSNSEPLTILSWCLYHGMSSFAHRLLTKYKAKAAYPCKPLAAQPVVMLAYCSNFTDAEALSLLRLMIANSPDLLEMDCYREKGTTGTESATVRATPIFAWTANDKPRCLELLLTCPGAKQMASQVVTLKHESGRYFRNAPLVTALKIGAWECADLLVRHGQVSVTETLDAGVSDCGHAIVSASALEIIRKANSSRDRPPRSVVAAIEAAAKREMAAAATSAQKSHTCSGGAGGSGAAACACHGKPDHEGLTTNAFEVPVDADDDDDFGAGALSQGKKQGGKKKAGKKKSGKGKKKKSGKAAAAAGIEGESSSDEDEEPFEEPDDNLVDSRYAPSLDAMLAEREREREREAAAGKRVSGKK